MDLLPMVALVKFLIGKMKSPLAMDCSINSNGNVETSVGEKFFQLLESHFTNDNVLYPIINKNRVKLSYSCMENVSNIISKHNSNILRGAQLAPPPCECQGECPVEGQCQQTGIVYQASIHLPNNKVEKYVGLTERKLEERYKEYTRSFEKE